jgi:TRAP-type C4-dicarboxylate transport system permease small subunit
MSTSHDISAGPLLRRTELLLRWSSNALFWVAVTLVAAMMVHVVVDVTLKLVFNRPVPFTVEMVAHYYMVAVVFLPLPLVEFRNSGVSVDLFYRMMAAPSRRTLMLLSYVAQVFFFGVLAYQSWLDALDAMKAGKFVYTEGRLDIWPPAFFLPFGFFLAALVSLLRIQQVATRSDWERLSAVQNFDDPSPETP